MSAVLLDSHTLIWWWTDPGPIGLDARVVLEAGVDKVLVSPASVWEIANKQRLGKLTEIEDFEGSYDNLMRENGFESLAITDVHAMLAGAMDGNHRDPFDRMIAAQALVEGLPVLTRDREIAAFGCKVLW